MIPFYQRETQALRGVSLPLLGEGWNKAGGAGTQAAGALTTRRHCLCGRGGPWRPSNPAQKKQRTGQTTAVLQVGPHGKTPTVHWLDYPESKAATGLPWSTPSPGLARLPVPREAWPPLTHSPPATVAFLLLPGHTKQLPASGPLPAAPSRRKPLLHLHLQAPAPRSGLKEQPAPALCEPAAAPPPTHSIAFLSNTDHPVTLYFTCTGLGLRMSAL